MEIRAGVERLIVLSEWRVHSDERQILNETLDTSMIRADCNSVRRRSGARSEAVNSLEFCRGCVADLPPSRGRLQTETVKSLYWDNTLEGNTLNKALLDCGPQIKPFLTSTNRHLLITIHTL